MQAYEALYERAGRVETYAHLLYDSDTRDVTARDLSQKVEQRLTELRNLTLFFDLEWLELPDDVAERLIADPALAPYAHYLRHERAFRPHRLTEAEEKVVNEKDVTGRSAWGRLHTELDLGADLLPGAGRADPDAQPLPGALPGLRAGPGAAPAGARHPLRRPRRAGAGAHVRLRHADPGPPDGRPAPPLRLALASRHLSNELDAAAVETMMQVVEANYELAQDYYRLKARLLGLERLIDYDRYAPVAQRTGQVPIGRRRADIVQESYGAFSPRAGEIVAAVLRPALDRRRAAPGQARRGVLRLRRARASTRTS